MIRDLLCFLAFLLPVILWSQEESNNAKQLSNLGLQIDNSPNRGLNYTDTLGSKYSYRNIPITITNDTIFPIHLNLALSGEYDYPSRYGDHKFKVFLLPKELTQNEVTYDTTTYELRLNELRRYFDKGLYPPYNLNETLNPGEKCVITIGTLYPRPTKCGVLPNALFLNNRIGPFDQCDYLVKLDESTNSRLALMLKLDFCNSCTIIPCGQLSYPKH